MKDTDRVVCLQHDHYHPCRKLASGERPHCWALQTIHMTYGEREFKEGVDTEQLDTLNCNQTNDR